MTVESLIITNRKQQSTKSEAVKAVFISQGLPFDALRIDLCDWPAVCLQLMSNDILTTGNALLK